MERCILIRYGEIFLKSEPVFKLHLDRLIQNIRSAFKANSLDCKVEKERGRIFLTTSDISKACEILKTVFGIFYFSPCFVLDTIEVKKIKKFIADNYKSWIKPPQTFAVRVRKSVDSKYTSQELEKLIGSVVNRKVNLKNQDVEIGIEIRKKTYIFTDKIKGLGGMPVSTSGKVISLISGGIDSPVASFLMMKRGCHVVFIHFHSFPIVSKASIYKTKELIKILDKYQVSSKVYLVPFGEIQMYLKSHVEPRNLIVLYRRFMFKIAEMIAKKERVKALITGENLAQVSSQTLDNLCVIEEVSSLPVLRPLIGMDKSEIIDMAKKIGTYDNSIKPQEDCCTLFVPKHPSAKTNLKEIKKIEKKIPVNKLIKKVIEKTEKITI